MKAIRIKGLAELIEAVHELRKSVDTLSQTAQALATRFEDFGPPCDDDEDHPPHGPPKKKGPKKKHPKKKGF